MVAPLLITYISASALVTLLAIGRRISFTAAFITSLIMSPIVGLITVLKTEKNIHIKHYSTRYVCPECNIEYTQQKKCCDFCKDMGKEIKLKPTRVLLYE